MDTAEEEGYVNKDTRVDMFNNDLVMVSKEGSGFKDVTLDDIKAGKYPSASATNPFLPATTPHRR